MSESIRLVENVERKPLFKFSEKSYLDYSMYVILDRALPHIGDGLKPVQRRIVYAMSELGLKAVAKYKKSARTVGDVLGKFHPHGDTACYEAMVLMAQPFSFRYPLVDGQGNWGAPDDPKSFAAMRYTEAKLSPYAEVLLKELNLGTVEWVPNFDGTLDEPSVLPARLPNVLLNGAAGIAVGMATDIPPHNLREVAEACCHLLENPKAELSEVLNIIQGPDFPTESEIVTSRADIAEIYQRGVGSIRLRAVYHEEQHEIVVTSLPYQTSGAKVLEQIAQQMQAKKLPMVSDLRDESDHENPTRLVIVPRSNRVNIEELMSHLFAITDLERNYRVNLNMVGLDGRPKVKDLLTLLNEWLDFRIKTVKLRLEHQLTKILERLHKLEALLIVYLNLDEVIKIIREEEQPKPILIERFKLTEIQAETILETKLRHLTRLEEMKIRTEQAELEKEAADIQKTLSSNRRIKTLIRKEITEDAKVYGDERRSKLVERSEAKVMSEEQFIPAEAITIILSEKGWVRAAKGHEVNGTELNYRSGDGFKSQAVGKSNQQAVFLDSTGRAYACSAHQLPSARGQGEPLTGRFDPVAGATFEAVMSGEPELQLILASDAGYGFVTSLKELYVKNRKGKAALKLPLDSHLLMPRAVKDLESEFLAAVTSEGYLLLFPIADLPVLAKGKGNKIINIPAARLKSREEYVIDIAVLGEVDSLQLMSGKRTLTLKPSDLAHYHGDRAKRGRKLPRGFQRVDGLMAIKP